MAESIPIDVVRCAQERSFRPELRTISLARREVLVLSSTACQLQILCGDGILWITQVGDPEDHILERGERFTITRPGIVVVQGMRDR
jgi:hypothetical protein